MLTPNACLMIDQELSARTKYQNNYLNLTFSARAFLSYLRDLTKDLERQSRHSYLGIDSDCISNFNKISTENVYASLYKSSAPLSINNQLNYLDPLIRVMITCR